MMESLVTEYTGTGYIRERTGAILPKIAPSNVYPTQSGMVLIAGNQDAVFSRLCEAMGAPALAQDPRYKTHHARGDRQQELDELIARWSATKSTDEVLELMHQHGVPAGLIYRAPDMLKDPHFKARNAIVTVNHPELGEVTMQNVAPKLSATPGGIRSPAPTLGQHNDEIYLQLLGLPEARYRDLRAQSVI
jgi:crotonobetainyl-CoA:carnitine CoA-transferase CaiB-like acyl-CoA transferase